MPHDGGEAYQPPSALNMKTHLIIAATLLLAGSSLADTYRVHYSIRGSGRGHHRAPRQVSADSRRIMRARTFMTLAASATVFEAFCNFAECSVSRRVRIPGASRQSPCAAARAQVFRKKLAAARRPFYLEKLR